MHAAIIIRALPQLPTIKTREIVSVICNFGTKASFRSSRKEPIVLLLSLNTCLFTDYSQNSEAIIPSNSHSRIALFTKRTALKQIVAVVMFLSNAVDMTAIVRWTTAGGRCKHQARAAPIDWMDYTDS